MPLSAELLELIFVMEKAHKAKLSARFKEHLGNKRVVCLGTSSTASSLTLRHGKRVATDTNA